VISLLFFPIDRMILSVPETEETFKKNTNSCPDRERRKIGTVTHAITRPGRLYTRFKDNSARS